MARMATRQRSCLATRARRVKTCSVFAPFIILALMVVYPEAEEQSMIDYSSLDFVMVDWVMLIGVVSQGVIDSL
jgi:hypothetical protein